MAGYTKNYIYIYATQAVSILLGLMSLFVVIPYLSSNKEVYGIYAICSSLTIFFSYADIGFITSGQKFAAEAYIQNNKKKELQIIGFSAFILLSLLCIISLGIFVLAYEPSLLIHNLSNDNHGIARILLIILACSSPIYCFQRIGQIIYSVRMSEYLFHLLQIAGSFIKISSIFYFFGSGNYDIIGYFLAIQIISLIVVAISFWIARRKYQIGFMDILRNLRFRIITYHLLKGLAFASLFGTVCWILYYEVDNIIISKLLGAESVAIFSIAFSVLTMFRSVFGSLYAPYTTRFNYFVGLEDINGLNNYTKRIIEFFIPICIIPIVVMFFSAEPFVISWVGEEYKESATVLKFLLFCNILAFISYPSGVYITARQGNKYLYISSTIIVVVYWVGVLLTFQTMGVVSFAIMKAVGMIISAIYCFCVVFYMMKESAIRFIMLLVKRYTIPIVATSFLCLVSARYMLYVHEKTSLMINLIIISVICVPSYFIFFLSSKVQRKEIRQLISNIKR